MSEFAESLEGARARTFDEATLAPVRQLNALALETLAACARHPAWKDSSWEKALGPNFPQLPPAFRAELARSPVILLEFSGSVFAGDGVPDIRPPAFLALEKAIELAQMTLTLAWTFLRQDVAATRIVFGLTDTEAERIQRIDLRDVPRIAERAAVLLRPRWYEHPRIWHELLRHPFGTKGLQVAPPYLRILQRQLAIVRPATGATRLTRRPGS